MRCRCWRRTRYYHSYLGLVDNVLREGDGWRWGGRMVCQKEKDHDGSHRHNDGKGTITSWDRNISTPSRP